MKTKRSSNNENLTDDSQARKIENTFFEGGLLAVGDAIEDIYRANGNDTFTPECWHDDDRVPVKIAAILQESSKAMDAFCKGDKADFIEGMASVFIQTVGCVHGLGFNLGAAVLGKMAKDMRIRQDHDNN